MSVHFEGVVVGAASLLIIGGFHPIVIKCEYYFTEKVWPVFLLVGLGLLAGSLFVKGMASLLLGLVGVACLWSILELKEQTRRVERGWFPKNPRRK